MKACPACGVESPDEARFCMACGESFEPAAARRELRKTVTVVFTDVVESTPLGERLDPESLRRVILRFYEVMRSVVERYEGTIAQFSGDAVLAVFGIPLAHEDDALRAVRSAAEMRSALALLNEELRDQWGVVLAARTGINTGDVVAGDAVSGQPIVVGDAVNVAARLEQAASVGEILMGDATYRLVKDGVEAEPLEPIGVKGKTDPLAAWRLGEIGPLPPTRVSPFEAPFVGRGPELALMQQIFGRAIDQHICQLVTVLGQPGVGKSRLVEEAVARLGSDVTVLRGRCLPYGEGITFWPVVAVVQEASGITEADSFDDARTKLASVMNDKGDADAVVDIVAQVIGFTDAKATAEQVFWAVRRFLEELARAGPLVIAFDDIHWAEPTFLDLIDHVADVTRDASLVVTCIARDELLEKRPTWGGGKLNVTLFQLAPLPESDCGQLVGNLLGGEEIAADARSYFLAAAEGNPLFLEEMLSMLLEGGRLRREHDRWTLTGETTEAMVPGSIRALLAARLDRLDPDDRRVIEVAAVIGKVFPLGAVQELSPDGEDVGERLQTLVRKELLRTDPGTFADADVYNFRHILIRDATYDAIPKEVRAELHERYATWLEVTLIGGAREYEEILGYHLEQACHYHEELGRSGDELSELRARAGARLGVAGRRALGRGDAAAAANLLGRAVDLLPNDDPARLKLLPDLGIALRDVGRLDDADRVLADAIAQSQAADEPAIEARGRVERSFLRVEVDPEGWRDEALEVGRRAVDVFEKLGDDAGVSLAHRLLAEVHWQDGRTADTERVLERALEHARRAGDEREEMKVQGFLAASAFWGHVDAATGIRRLEDILRANEGNRWMESGVLPSLGCLRAMQGDIDGGRELVRRGIALHEELGLEVVAAANAMISAFVEMLDEKPEEAERGLRRGYAVLERVGEQGFRGTLAAYLAHALYDQRRYDEAERFTHISEELTSTHDLITQVDWRTARAKVLARRGEFDDAEHLAREAKSLIDTTDHPNDQATARVALAEVLNLAGKYLEATRVLKQAVELYEQKGNVVSARKAHGLLNELDS